MYYYDKEYNNETLGLWVAYEDSDIIDILSDYRKSLFGVLDYIKGNHETDLFDTSESVKEYRRDILVGLIARSMFDNPEEVDDEKVKDFLDIIEYEFKDLLTAPASTRFHGCWEGGLLDHCFAVFESALKSKKAYYDDERVPKKLYPMFFLLHDACKFNCYTVEKKNVKNVDTGKWETKDAYTTRRDYISSFHGSESVDRIYQLILKYKNDLDWLEYSFTPNWRLAITYHMGMYNMCDAEMNNYGNAKHTYPEVLLMHHADMIASQIFDL